MGRRVDRRKHQRWVRSADELWTEAGREIGMTAHGGGKGDQQWREQWEGHLRGGEQRPCPEAGLGGQAEQSRGWEGVR
eukprot:scaffold95791_cov28-Tisochrysis_lutea.AAC.3